MKFDCRVIEQPSQHTLSFRTRSSVDSLPQLLGKTFGMIAEYISSSRAQMAGAPYVAYYNLDIQNLDVEIGIPVSEKLPDKDNMKASEISEGKYATVVHVGPFSEMAPTYEALNRWIEQNNYEPTGVAYEIYIDDPAITPMEELKTQIILPIK